MKIPLLQIKMPASTVALNMNAMKDPAEATVGVQCSETIGLTSSTSKRVDTTVCCLNVSLSVL